MKVRTPPSRRCARPLLRPGRRFWQVGMNRWAGRVPGSLGIKKKGDNFWCSSYLSAAPVYSARHLTARFCAPLALFRVLEDEPSKVEPTLRRRTDCKGRRGHSVYDLILNSLRRLGSGASYGYLDDQSLMSEESQRNSFMAWLRAVRPRFGLRLLRPEPTIDELQAILDSFAARVFLGCIGCVDCEKLLLRNWPRALERQYQNLKDSKLAIISYEAVADCERYCWH